MRKSTIRSALLGILLLGFAIPALADGGAKGCSNLGTWFGVSPFPPGQVTPPVIPPPPWDPTYLSGWSVTVTGKSNKEGTNLFEFPVFDPKFTILGLQDTEPFASADRIGNMRGNWKRTGGNTFDYTFMGFAYTDANMPAYIAKISGQVVLIEDCQYQYTTAVMEVFWPNMNPFDEYLMPEYVIPLGAFYGYRAKVDVAPFPTD
jgi:hypothetical protein